MAFSKIILNNVTQMDVTDTTAEAYDVASGKYFYGADGEKKIGSANAIFGNAFYVTNTDEEHGGTVTDIIGVDISDSTITNDKILQGYIGYSSNGTKITGTASGGTVYQDANGAIVFSENGIGAPSIATGTFTITSHTVMPTITHNLNTQKIAVLIYPENGTEISATAGYKTWYLEYMNTNAVINNISFTADWTPYNSSNFEDKVTISLPDSNLRCGVIHASPWTTQNSSFQAGNPQVITSETSRATLTDNTVLLTINNTHSQWCKGTFRWIVWRLV